MAHILYRGGAARGDNTDESARSDQFRPDDFLYGEPEPQGVDAARFQNRSPSHRSPSNLSASHLIDTPDYDDGMMQGVGGRDAPQAMPQTGRGRMNYAPSQHPSVHQSLMQAVRDENPAVQHFIDLQRAAEARAAELAAQLAARQLEAAQRAEQASARAAAAEARAHAGLSASEDGGPDFSGSGFYGAAFDRDALDPAAFDQGGAARPEFTPYDRGQDGHGWTPPFYGEDGSNNDRGHYAANASEARNAAARALQANAFSPRAALAAWMPAGGMPWLMRRGAALASVAMALGLTVWGYQLAQRDIAGLQVIKAPPGVAREAPLDPGGELARHTGLSVNSVAAIGTAAPLAAQITLAPRVAQLSDDDAPMSALKPLPLSKKAEAVLGEKNAVTSDPETGERIYEAALPIPDASFNMVGQPGVEATSRQPAPLSDDLTPPEADEALSAGIEAALIEVLPDETPDASVGGLPTISASIPGLSTSPRPIARPNSDLQAEAAAVAVADALTPEVADVIEISPEDLPAGTRLVQIGAHDSAEQARTEWDRVAVQFASLMEGKRRVIQEAVSGGRTFYRLRVEGFKDVAASRHFCAALVAERTNCIPAQVR
jgi:hypothetical protein